jgi:hypothetical protein
LASRSCLRCYRSSGSRRTLSSAKKPRTRSALARATYAAVWTIVVLYALSTWAAVSIHPAGDVAAVAMANPGDFVSTATVFGLGTWPGRAFNWLLMVRHHRVLHGGAQYGVALSVRVRSGWAAAQVAGKDTPSLRNTLCRKHGAVRAHAARGWRLRPGGSRSVPGPGRRLGGFATWCWWR